MASWRYEISPLVLKNIWAKSLGKVWTSNFKIKQA